MATELIRYDAMCRAIGEAYAVDEVKDIRDKAVAIEHYARQAKNTEAERQACEIRLRAERKAGELRRKEEKAQGRRSDISPTRGEKLTNIERRRELGISKKQDEQWQKLATIPQKEFDAVLAASDKPTTNGIIRATSEPKLNPVSRDALWLWGRLRDFREFVLDKNKNPADVMESMTPEMLDETHLLAPQVAGWLKRIGATG